MVTSSAISGDEVPIRKKIIGSILIVKEWSRIEIWTTVALYLHIFAWGVNSGVLSTSLLDLELLTSSSTSQVGFMFSVINMAGIVTAALAGQFMACIDHRLLLSIGLTSMGVTVALLPWARSFQQLLIFAALSGLSQGSLDTGQNVLGMLIWGWRGVIYMQIFHGIYAIGSYVGPWVARPFLAPTWEQFPSANSSTNYTTISPNASSVEIITGESKIMYAFLIVGIYYVLAAIFYLVIYVCLRKDINDRKIKSSANEEKDGQEECSKPTNPNLRKLWYQIPMTLMTGLRFASYVGLEIMFSSFVMTFSVKSLGLSKDEGLRVTSSYLAAFATSRFLGIFFSFVISPTVYVLIDISIMLSAFIGMAIFAKYHPMVVLLCSLLVGFGQGTFYACSMSWASRYLYITERIGAVLTTGSWLGVLSLPALAGYVIENYSQDAFIYLCLADVLLLASVTIVSTIIGLKFGSPPDDTNQGNGNATTQETSF